MGRREGGRGGLAGTVAAAARSPGPGTTPPPPPGSAPDCAPPGRNVAQGPGVEDAEAGTTPRSVRGELARGPWNLSEPELPRLPPRPAVGLLLLNLSFLFRDIRVAHVCRPQRWGRGGEHVGAPSRGGFAGLGTGSWGTWSFLGLLGLALSAPVGTGLEVLAVPRDSHHS